MSENDPANLRLYEAFYIRKFKPILNFRDEWTEFGDLLFQYCILETTVIRFKGLTIHH